MATKDCIATPKKKLPLRAALFKRRTNVLGMVVASVLVLAIPAVTQAQTKNIIESVTEDINQADPKIGKGGASCQKLENVTTPIRAGQRAFKHLVDRCGERSELEMNKTVIGGTYTYGWSMYLPTSWENSRQSYDIVMQLATYPTKRDFLRYGCGGAGSKMSIRGDTLRLDFQHKGNTQDIECDQYALGNINEMKGKWVDFVIQAKWTGNSDGFFKLWTRVDNSGYVQKVNYAGPTYWNDEARGPYFKMGLYKGNPNWDGPGAPRYLYTDEYRLGNATSSFQEVAPGGSGSPSNSNSIRVEAETMALSAYRIEPGNSAASGSALISLKNAPSSTDTASSTFSGDSGKYDVYLGYFDEKDGAASLQVSVGGVQLAELRLDQGLKANLANAETLVRQKVKSGLSINKGAKIEIKGTANQEEWARVDYIEFVSAP